MAKSQSRKEVIELREMEDLTTSIGRGMDNLAEKSDRHLDVLTNSTDMMKKIVEEMEDSEGLGKSINALKQKEKQLTKENWGLNEDLKNELLNQVTAAKEALSIEQKRRDMVDELANKAEDFGSAMTEQLNGLKSSLAEIPVIGKVLNNIIPYDTLNKKIGQTTSAFTDKFSDAFTDNLKSGKGFVSSFSSGMTQGLGAAGEAIGPLLTNPYVAAGLAILAVAAIGVIAFYKMSAAAKQFRQETGLLNSQTKGLEAQIGAVYNATATIGGSMEDASQAAIAFTREFSGIEMASTEVLTSMVVLNKNFGVGVEEATKLNKVFQNIGGLSAEQSQLLISQTVSLADMAKVAPGQVIKDMAENSEYAYKYFQGSPKALASAAVQAAKLGTSIGEAGKVADNLLDFENSITSELEASAILGTNLNLGQARYLAANGKILEAQQSVVDQVGQLGDLTKLNTFEQEALVKATGMSIADLENQRRIKERFSDLDEKQLAAALQFQKTGGDISKMNKADLEVKTKEMALQQEMQSKFDKSANALSAIGSEIMMAFMPIGETIMNALGPIMQIVGGLIVGFLKPFMAIINTIFDHISKAFAPLSDMMGPGNGLFSIFEKIGEIIGFIVSLFRGPLVYAIELAISMASGIIDIFSGIVKIFKGDFMGGLAQIGDGIFSMIRAPFVAAFNTVMDYLEGFFTIFESLGAWVHKYFIDPFEKFTGGIGNVLQTLNPFSSDEPATAGTPPAINDGIVQGGKVVSTHPADTLIATKNPEGLANSLEGGIGGLLGGVGDAMGKVAGAFNGSNRIIEKLDELIVATRGGKNIYMDREKVSSAVATTNEKSGENRFGLMGA